MGEIRSKGRSFNLNEQTEPIASSTYVVDNGQTLSHSLLWDIQRRYYENQGIEAWRTNIVPSYITSNPYIAQSYARVVLGYLRDCQPTLDPSEPVYLVELGAGGGRFAFHFLRKFEALLAQSPFPDLKFCYVLTDLPERNLNFWQQHPALQDWVAAGKLDFARFDAVADREIQLRHAGRSITPGGVKNPLVVLANYFFDSLPNDAFHIEAGRIQECLIKLTSRQEEPDPTAMDILPRLVIRFLTQEGDQHDYYQDPELDTILERYRSLENSYLLFPIVSIRLLRGLIQLTGNRALMLFGDYGISNAAEWDHNGSPDIRIHGSISMEVNYHALGTFIENQGGRFLAPGFLSPYLTVCAFILGENPSDFSETRLAYEESIRRAGPNDFFLLKRGLESHYPSLSLEELLAILRISGWDAHLFLDCFPALLDKAASSHMPIQMELLRALDFVWDNYYHLGEERDLPFNIGVLLFRLGRSREALIFFERSLNYYGPSHETLYNLALCQTQLRMFSLAWSNAKKALLLNPAFEPTELLIKEIKKNHPRILKQ